MMQSLHGYLSSITTGVLVLSCFLMVGTLGLTFPASAYSQDKSFVTPVVPPLVLPGPIVETRYPPDPMARRTFLTTTQREQISLAGFWDFIPDPEGTGESKGYYRNFPAPETRLSVPGTWNAVARYHHYSGAGWYRTRISLPRAGNIRLHFGAVPFHGKVWLDGKFLGEHFGGYSPFALYVPELKAGEHVLIVLVDNTMTATELPTADKTISDGPYIYKRNIGWFPFGGLTREGRIQFRSATPGADK